MTLNIDTQVRCDTCDVARIALSTATIDMDLCPVCGRRDSLRQIEFDPIDLLPDQIALMKVTPTQAQAALQKAIPELNKRYNLDSKFVETAIYTPLYIPFWYFDMAVDADGPGPQKPEHGTRRVAALRLPFASNVQPLTRFAGPLIRFEQSHLASTALVVPQVTYREAAKSVLLGVQDDLSGEGLAPTRQSGIIGQVGMETYLQLIPIWLVTMIEPLRMHQVVINGVDGKTYISKPRTH